ncbi:hypothetical protein DMN91_012916 [Ooceraea biroi]|uniref:DNA polymerase zeta catalytic subunit n=1 Tax=Ooceraea biroi TaxID=2015173 RepID=A0A3L8D460_OOCBI|nr:hypothetical protein DMN91_012916 [Ooceraea biroi]
MFSITLVNIESYQASPIPELDVTFSEFRGSEVKKVPVIRIFGSTATGKKTCLHVHGVFPYMYVPCTVQENADSYAYQLAASIDSALNTSFGSTVSTSQHVYKIQQVSGIPFYGYHEKEHLFFKIYFYNPAILKRTADLLRNGAVLNQNMQLYEAHIPYILQFMMDYNLYGMNLINLNCVKYRHSLQGCEIEGSQNKSSMDSTNSQVYLPTSVTRQSMCELEVDAHASEILNRQSITKELVLNPGIAGIWNEERARRAQAGLQSASSQLLYPKTPGKIILPPTSSDIYQKEQLLKRLNAASQVDETVVSNTIVPSYPIEVEEDKNVLNASYVLNHTESLASEENNIERMVSDNTKLLQLASLAFLEANRSQSNVTDTSILDADDIQLVEMLANLAEENETTTNVDDDSVLGSQYSVFSEPAKNDPEEEEVEDLNITSLDLDSLSPWESVCKESNSIIVNKRNTESANSTNNIAEESENVTLTDFPQFDGVDDSDENILKYEKSSTSCLSENNSRKCCTAVLSANVERAVPVINKRKNHMCDFYKNLHLVDVIEHFNASNPNQYHLRKELYDFVNRCYFHIFIKSDKNLRDTLIKKIYYLKDKKRNIVKKKRRQELCITYQLPLDHQDLDVYDVDEASGTTDDINQYNIKDHEEHKRNYVDAKLRAQRRALLDSNYCSHQEIYSILPKFTISSVDGAAGIDTDSSDSELESDITINRQEKRICVYKSAKRDIPRATLEGTPKKRKLDFETDESPGKRRNATARTPKRQYSSPGKGRLSGNYSPLNIIITSPKTSRSPLGKCESPKERHVAMSDAASTSTTPKRKTHLLRMSLLREKRGTNFSSLDLERKSDNDERATIKETDIVQSTDNSNAMKANETTVSHEAIESYESSSVKHQEIKEVRKRLSFLNHDEVENTESNHPASQSERLAAIGHFVDQAYADATVLSFSNKNDDSVSSSQRTEKSNSDTSPERNYSSNIRKLARRSMQGRDIIPETDFEDEEDTCDTTFTQSVNKKIENFSQSLSLEVSSIARSPRNASITITTRYKPPDPERVLRSMTLYGIPRCRAQKPFFSNKCDLRKQKESASTSSAYFDVPAFKSSLEDVTSLGLWRRMKVNEFHASGAAMKTCHIKRTLAGYNLLTIKPLVTPPSPKGVTNWIRAKRYLLEKNRDIKLRDKKRTVKDTPHSLININNKKDESSRKSETSSDHSINDDSTVKKSVSLTSQEILSSGTFDDSKTFGFTQHSDKTSEDSLNPSLKKALQNPLLYKQNKDQQSSSYGQIECLSKESYGNVSSENIQNVRAVSAHQYLTLLSLEVHVVTRENLLPDPQHDPVAALFYAIYNDVPTDANQQIEHSAIIVNPDPVSARLSKIHSAGAMCPILYVPTEQDMFNSLIKLIEQHNPEILLGWETEALSWGYIFQRALHLGFSNFPLKISKVPYTQVSSKSDIHTSDKEDTSEIKVPGRNILDVWRIMRHEATLLTYTFENVMHHVLHERIPCPSFKTLSTWWKHKSMIVKSRVIRHYVIRVVGTLKLLNHLDIIGRTCEHARLFGIQFYEVFSRGSQFRVESMMLRLAKPMNYIPISPSVHQRARMRAPECLPLIMEPESEFYTDPLVVLDFQSLYPSMIIAYNYCFSTCLGRIEHIGQYGPFDFGAATLITKRSTALKLQEKINFSPCGVAFAKREVRQGILPRMLTEILNTRLMVKESMKLYPAEDRTLQRLLHSQQLGLKLIANVTYGYTSANFSGRMPCIEIGDSVVSKGRETLERAIKLVETTPKWGARVVYGDTDSLFVLLPGKSREEAFTIGEEIADAVSAANPAPVKLKFEKVLHPAILQTKKRYCGYMYERRSQEQPEFLAKGIETVRRDGCPAVAKVLEKSLRILFDTKDVSLVKSYVTRQFEKIFQRRVSIQDLTFAKEFRGMRGYKANACVPALELTRRLTKKDPRAVPRTSERVRYVIVAGAPNQALIQCVRAPMEVIADPALIPNSVYYITKVIIPPLNRCFNLFGIDVNTWYKEMSHRFNLNNIAHLGGGDNSKSSIRQFFSSAACITCGEQTNKDVCPECHLQPDRTILVLLEKIKQLERNYQQITAICHSCIGRSGEIECASLDCPVLYRMAQARKDLEQVSSMNDIIYKNSSSGIKKMNAVAEWY